MVGSCFVKKDLCNFFSVLNEVQATSNRSRWRDALCRVRVADETEFRPRQSVALQPNSQPQALPAPKQALEDERCNFVAGHIKRFPWPRWGQGGNGFFLGCFLLIALTPALSPNGRGSAAADLGQNVIH